MNSRRFIASPQAFRSSRGNEAQMFCRSRRSQSLLTSATTLSMSPLLHVVAVNDVLIAQVQFPVGDDRVCPDAALGIAYVGLRIQFEPAVLFPTLRRRFSEHHCSAVFLQTVQHAVRAAERPFPERLFLAPHL